MNEYDEKILNIKKNHRMLLGLVKEKLEEEGNIFSFNTKNIVDVLTHDKNVVDKYEAVISAQKLIEKYQNDIKNAKSTDEIKEIRKNLNSCINKVKKAMKNRGIDDVEFNNYCEQVNKYRKRIAENIRFIKRKEKINEIETLLSNFKNLNEEELIKLKKLVKNELAYGKRNINKYGDISNLEISSNEEISSDNTQNHSKSLINPELTMDFATYDDLQSFLDSQIDTYEKRYSIMKSDEYTGGLIKNISIFSKNLPKLINNKQRAKCMLRDYYLFCRKSELLGYGDYVHNNNSILHNIKMVLKNSILKNKENMLEDEHSKAIDWIINFCDNNDMSINYRKSSYIR